MDPQESNNKDGEALVGTRVKVWWPGDEMYYEGVVDSFDRSKRKHKVLYDDGDEEILNLKEERWEILDDAAPVAEEVSDHGGPDASDDNDMFALNMAEPAANEVTMEAFYASIDAEFTPLSHPHQPPRTRPSENTLKAWRILRHLVGKTFSLLYHPALHGLMRDALKHLLNLPPGEGVSSRTMSVLQKLSTSFDQWSMDYHNAIGKIKSAAECMSKAEKANEGLNSNVRVFKEIVTYEKALCNKLATLEQKKAELERQINVIKAEIAPFKAKRDIVAKRKRQVFENGKELRSERDGLRSQVPRLEAEKELTKAIEANIEVEWSKLGKEVLQSTSFVEDWI